MRLGPAKVRTGTPAHSASTDVVWPPNSHVSSTMSALALLCSSLSRGSRSRTDTLHDVMETKRSENKRVQIVTPVGC